MAKYRVIDGKVFEAGSAQELCEALHGSAFMLQGQSLEEYLAGYKKRVKEFDGIDIRAWPPETFIEDLLKNSLITRLD